MSQVTVTLAAADSSAPASGAYTFVGPVTVAGVTDAAGFGSVELPAGVYLATFSAGGASTAFKVTVPGSGGPYTVASIR